LLGGGGGGPVGAGDADRDKATAVIERAIKAHGGADALNKAMLRSRSGKGVAVSGGGEVPFSTEETVRFPDRSRTVLEFGRARLTLVLAGEKGWLSPAGGAAQAMTKEMFAEQREELYVWLLMTLTPLLKDDFDLEAQPDAKVNDRETAVVKVKSKGKPTASLFFDKKTGFLVKIARRAKETGVPVDKEYLYSDYKDYDGVQFPEKETITIFGKKRSEVKFTNYKVLSKIADATFDKP
jgi:hypothetical protein